MLVLTRGGFCPKERRQHEGLLQFHREMQVGYRRLVTISSDNLIETKGAAVGSVAERFVSPAETLLWLRANAIL